jgi:hypothetical protein
MGVSIAICELDSDASACKSAKTSILKVNLKDVTGFESCAEFDLLVPVAVAKTAFGAEFDAFAKRNRVDVDTENIYLDKVKNDSDKQKLAPLAKKQYTGWIAVDNASADTKKRLLDLADPDNRLTKWDMLSFDEMGEACKKCVVSWDEGRGCIGTFGPDNSALPEIAAKYGCSIIAGVPNAVKNKTMFTKEDAARMLEEIKVLREKLPLESKMVVRRYSGVLDRLEKVANISIKYGTKFYFL